MNKPRILIVEDDSIIAMDLGEALISLNYQVAGKAASGKEALEIMDSKQIDLILMDISLEGEMDGIELAGIAAEKYNLPVIFLTAFADKATLDRVKVLEPYGYILKPFRAVELRTSIELALHKHSVQHVRSNGTPKIERTGIAPLKIPDFRQIVPNAHPANQMMQVTILNFLESFSPFSELGSDMLSSISSVCYIQSFKRYESIVYEGAERAHGFAVMDGRAAVFNTSSGGKELIVALLGAADLFGIYAVLERAPFTFSARAHVDTRILWIPREVIFHITDSYPEISRELFQNALVRLQKAHDLSRAIAHERVEMRITSALLAVANTFAEKAADDPHILEVEMTRQELGELVGTTPETTSRVLNRLEAEGMVELSNSGKVRIKDSKALEQSLH